MKKSKNTKNKILLNTLLVTSVVIISVLSIYGIYRNSDGKLDINEVKTTNENTDDTWNFENETVLTRPLVKKLGWDMKTEITLKDWEVIPNVTILGYGDTYENSPFWNNTSDKNKLKSIEIPDRVTTINSWAFGADLPDLQSLEKITFSERSKLTTIGRRAFFNSRLTYLDLPISVLYVDDWAFENTPHLKGEKIWLSTFLKNSTDSHYGFTQAQWDKINWRVYTWFGTTLTKAHTLGWGWDKKTKITLDDWRRYAPNVTHIGTDNGEESPFKSFTTLERIEIPEKVKVIGPYGLAATNLNEIIFEGDSRLHTIEDYAFSSTDITEFYVSDKVTRIGDNAFANATLLVGNNVSMLSKYRAGSLTPLYGFTELQWNNIDWRWEKFYGTLLTSFDIINLGWDRKHTIAESDWENAGNVTAIANGAFRDNSLLTNIFIPNRVTAIGENALTNTTALVKATFSYKVTHNSVIALYGFSQKVWEEAIILDLPKTGMIDKIIARELLKKDDNIISWYSIQDYNGIDVEAFANTNITKIDIQANASEFILERDVFKNTSQLTEIKLDKSHKMFIHIGKYGLTPEQVENITYYDDSIPPEPDKILNISAKKVSQEVIDAAYDILQKGQLENFTPEEIDALKTIFTNIEGNEDKFKAKLDIVDEVKLITLIANEGYIFIGDEETIDSLVEETIMPDTNSNSNIGLIVGILIGGITLIATTGLIIYFVKKLQKNDDSDDGEENSNYFDVTEQYNYEEND